MHQNLIIYSSTDGQTIKICKRIMSIIGDCKIVSINEAKNENLSKYGKVIVGASIRYGKHKPELYEYISENCDHLIDINASFFSVNVVARKPEKNTPLTNPYVQKFLSISKWHPSLISSIPILMSQVYLRCSISKQDYQPMLLWRGWT
jgi:menaquinone-dependent protoporphyrinogen oxidase